MGKYIIIKNAKTFNVRKLTELINKAREEDNVYIDFHTIEALTEVLDFYKENYKEGN